MMSSMNTNFVSIQCSKSQHSPDCAVNDAGGGLQQECFTEFVPASLQPTAIPSGLDRLKIIYGSLARRSSAWGAKDPGLNTSGKTDFRRARMIDK
eukprot:scaffold10260_cov266-Chaetoceros_neogracile.AAC.70